MKPGELDNLEREVEQARARLVNDMERLRAPGTFSEVEGRVTEARDGLVGKVKQAGRDRVQDMLSAVQARVAANPGAALAIGAGLAWRLYRHPPVATVLVGAGVMSLLRTDPQHPALGSDVAARAVGMAGAAQNRVQEWRAGDPAGQASDLASAARERVVGMAGAARERVEDYADQARERISQTRERIGDFSSDAGGSAIGAIRRAARAGDRWTAGGQRAISGAVADMGDRDKVLLGVAALALAAAVGVAAQRRHGDPEIRD